MASPTKQEDASAESRLLRRRQKGEAHLTSGCGFGKEKIKLMHGFWTNMWPSLEKFGWSKEKGAGTKLGYVYFVPEGVDRTADSTVKGEDYFDRIRDVVDHVCSEYATVGEQEVGKTFQREIEDFEGMADERSARSARRSPEESTSAATLDLSWKDGGTTYPKASSRLGPRYQAPAIPPAGSFSAEEAKNDPDLQYDQVWDPERAKAAGVSEFVHASINSNRKEAAIVALHEQDYKPEKVMDIVENMKVNDGSDWSAGQKEKYHLEMFRLRKNVVDVARSMGCCNNVSYAYYLGKFKKSDDYRLLKSICEEERIEKLEASDQGLDACGICGDGGSLLICDGCEGEYHMTCLRPPLVNVPEGAWFCDSCVDSNFLEARDRLIQKFYVELGEGSKKRKVDEVDGENASSNDRKGKSGDLVLRPAESVLKAVKALASCISQALTPT